MQYKMFVVFKPVVEKTISPWNKKKLHHTKLEIFLKKSDTNIKVATRNKKIFNRIFTNLCMYVPIKCVNIIYFNKKYGDQKTSKFFK